MLFCERCSVHFDNKIIFDNHNEIVHNNLDQPLTDKEFETLEQVDHFEILRGPDTPRRQNLKSRLRNQK